MAVAAISAVLCACTSDPVARDLNDTTAPTMTLKLTASSTVPSGVAVLSLGTNDTLTGAGGSLFIVADNAKGVSWVELWMTTTRNCGGVIDGPGLAGAPAKRVTGNVSSTSAPPSLSAPGWTSTRSVSEVGAALCSMYGAKQLTQRPRQ